MSPPACTTLGVLVWTSREMPSERQAVRTLRVAATLLRSNSAGGPPDAGLGRDVHDGVAPVGGVERHGGVGEVAPDGVHAQRAQRRVVAPGHAHDVVAAGQQRAHDGAAEEAAAAGHEDPHGCPAAHEPSDCRSILLLWRMSTGKSSL